MDKFCFSKIIVRKEIQNQKDLISLCKKGDYPFDLSKEDKRSYIVECKTKIEDLMRGLQKLKIKN